MSDRFDIPLPAGQEPSDSLRELLFKAGRVLSNQGRFTEAIDVFEKALKEEDSPLEAGEIYFHLALAYERAGENRYAFYNYLQTIACQPQTAETILPKVHALLTYNIVMTEREWLQREWHSALAHASLRPVDRANVELFEGRVSLYLKDYSQATEFFLRAREMAPDDTRAVEGLGEALWRLGQLEQAIEYLSQAYDMAKQGNHAERLEATNAKLTQALAASGGYASALSRLGVDLEENTLYHYELLLTRSQCYLALGQPEKALEAAEAASKSESTASDPHLLRAQALIALKRYPEAVRTTNEALQRNPSNSEVLFYKSQALIEGQIDLDQARRFLTRYVKRVGHEEVLNQIRSSAFKARGNDWIGHYFIAEVYYILGYYQEAWQELNRAFELGLNRESDNLWASAQQLKAELLKVESRFQEAAECFYKAGHQFYLQNKYTIAIEQFNRIAKLKPDYASKPELVLIYLFWTNALRLLAFKYEPPSQEQLEQALNIWEEGYTIGYPPADRAWAYLVRALCLQELAQMASLNDGETERFWWEAACYLERSLLLVQDNASTWALLSYSYFSLNKYAVAMQATEHAKDEWSLKWRALMLAGVDDDRAIGAIKRCRMQLADPDHWLDYLEAVVLCVQKKFNEAIQLLDTAIEAEPDYLLLRITRGRAHRMAGHTEQAIENFRWIWDVIASDESLADLSDLEIWGDAGYELGYYDKAARIFQDLLRSSPESQFDVRNSLAFCFLALGKVDEASQLLREAPKYLRYGGVEVCSALQHLAELEGKLKGTSNSTLAQEVLEKYRAILEAKVEEFRALLYEEQAAEMELRQVVEGGLYESGSSPWLAAQEGLARLYIEAGRLKEAAEVYQMILACDPEYVSARFPEAHIGLARAFARLGFLMVIEGEQDSALDYFRRSIKLRTQGGQSDPMGGLVQDCTVLIKSLQQYWAFSDCLRVLEDDPSLDREQRYRLVAARLKLSRDKYRNMLAPLEKETLFSKHIPVVQPIDLELGPDLYKSLHDGVHQLMQIDLPAMQAHIRKKMGVKVPDVRVSVNPNVAGDVYRFMLYEVPLASGTAIAHERYCPDAASCQARGIDGLVTINPANGKEGMWLHESAWERVVEVGLPLWGPYQYIVYHLESLISLHLANFLGVQEVRRMINEWEKSGEEDRRSLVKQALPDDRAWVWLVQVLQGLEKEQVPIKSIEIILTAVARENPETLEVIDVIENVRFALRAELPGNDLGRQLVRLVSDFEEAIGNYIWEQEGKHFLAIPDESAEGFLHSVRVFLVDKDIENLTLLVRRSDLRPFVRRLIEQEFPSLVVLTESELIKGRDPFGGQVISIRLLLPQKV